MRTYMRKISYLSKIRLSLSIALGIAISTNLMLAETTYAKTTKHASHKTKGHHTHQGHGQRGKTQLIKTSHHSKNYVLKRMKVKGKWVQVKFPIKQVGVAPAPKLSFGERAGLHNTPDPLGLSANAVLVVDQEKSEILLEKNAQVPLPMASITKLMTGLVVVEAQQDLNEMIEITNDDIDRTKGTGSRLPIGAVLSRADLLHIALMSSENRAASALGRNYPGGLPAFVQTMNAKAKELGMTSTQYVDSSGLSNRNVASAQDLAKLLNAAYQHPLIRQYSTDTDYVISTSNKDIEYGTTNRLIRDYDWVIGLQKTGYISEAGRCLVMQTVVGARPVLMVFLDAKHKMDRVLDADRVKRWLLGLSSTPASQVPIAQEIQAPPAIIQQALGISQNNSGGGN